MNSELSKAFGRDFLIGFFLPALFFGAGNFCLLRLLGFDQKWLEIDWSKPLEKAIVLGLLVWVLAVVLQAFNRDIFRFAEGYWPSWLRKTLSGRQLKKFRYLNSELNRLMEKDQKARQRKAPIENEQKVKELWEKLATNFPSDEKIVLPTAFGNVVCAYEDYSRVIYGFESINGWSRLLSVISKEYSGDLSNVRARVDLWLNTWFLGCIFFVEVAVFLWRLDNLTFLPWTLGVAFLIWFAHGRTLKSAIQYGEQVKGAFDVFLPALAAKLGYELSTDVDKNYVFWKAFSQTMVYSDLGGIRRMAEAGLKPVNHRDEENSKDAKDSESSIEKEDNDDDDEEEG